MAEMPRAIRLYRHTECFPFLMEGILTTLLSLMGGSDGAEDCVSVKIELDGGTLRGN